MINGQKQINVDAETHDRLKHVSSLTGVPMARLVSDWIQELFSIAVDCKACDSAYYKLESSILGHEVRCVLIGYNRKIHFGKGTETEMNHALTNMVEGDMKKKACGLA